jgi:threonylcarbamoyladenosine tRNA methylthiotransferase MtaB
MKKVHLVQYGCRLNQAEGSSIVSALSTRNLVNSPLEEADFIVFNTCTVTDKADQQSLYEIRRAKRKNPDAKIIVTGCFASTDKEELSKLTEIDYIFGNSEKSGILDFIADKQEPSNRPFSYPYNFKINKSRVSIKIQDGCNRSCSYCKIPQARGKAISRAPDTILAEAKARIDQGYNELILTGVNMGWYRNESLDFSGILSNICDIKGNFHIRLSSIEPGSLRAAFFETFKHPKVAQFLHVPLQSGSDKILRAMKRGYNTKSFRERISKIRQENPLIHIGTDIIIGFPGETEIDFQETCDFVKMLKFSNIHIFPYSSRKNTSIEHKIRDKQIKPIDESVIHNRIKKLTQIKKELYLNYLQASAGSHFRAVVEKKRENYIAVTENYVKVQLPKNAKYKAGEYMSLMYNEQGDCVNIKTLNCQLAS